MSCDGAGDVDGGHCCWINGEECEFLIWDGRPRCSLWDVMPTAEWEAAPIGRRFQEWPGKTCRDWPQNIPEVMAVGIGLCCWRNDGNMG